MQAEIVLIIIQNKNLHLLCLGRSLRGSALTLIITRYYVLLQKFLLCRTPGGSVANWEHEEGVSQRLAELVTSEKVSRKLQRKSTKAITQGMSDISHYYKSQLQNIIYEPAIAYNKIYV